MRKNSDASTVIDGANGRKNSLESNSMAFETHEEVKESMTTESLDDRYLKERRGTSASAQKNNEGMAGSTSRPSL